MVLQETYTLNNGVQIPKIGLGTWLIDNDWAAKAVRDAVELGYRHIDTAQAYENEAGVGRGIQTCGLPRDKIFVTSKVAAEAKTYEAAAASIDETLRKMGLDYLDMMIIHAPQPWATFREGGRYFAENKQVWKALEDAYQSGKLRAIGVSNFLRDDLENILSDCRVKPMVNQVLAHISNTPLALADFCKENGVLVEAYSPIAHGSVLQNQEIAAVAQRYGVTVPQLCVRYVLELGMVALPKTANPAHMEENAAVDFTISVDDMELLKNVTHIENYGEQHFFPVFAKGCKENRE